MDAAYSCEVAFSGISKSAKARIGADSIMVEAAGRKYFIDYADIDDFRLLNYHLFIYTKKGEIEFSKLGRDTENFFEKLWLAYDAKSRASLFLKTEPLVEREGDYAYTEDGVNHIGKAKIALYEDSLCILPHDSGARRIPLCFVKDINSVGYNQLLRLDTGEEYRIGRLGYDTKVFFDKTESFSKAAVAAWKSAHEKLEAELSDRLADRKEEYGVFKSLPGSVCTGLFAPYEPEFYFACIGKGKAAREFVIGENAATYLYTFDTDPETFQKSLAHACEAVGRNREVIYLPDEELSEKPLYRMAVERSRHLRFLRSYSAGRVIHTAGWEKNIRAFFV